MRLPVSISAVPTTVSEPPSSNCAGRGEQLFGNVHGLDVDAAAHGAAGVADPLVERAGQPGNRVEQHEDVLAHLGEALAAFDRQLGQANVAFDIAVEARSEDFALDDPLHIGDFFGPLIDQQHDHRDIGIVGRDAVADMLNEDRLAGTRRGDDQRALALAQRRQQIHHARGDGLLAGFEAEPFFRIDGRELVERFDFRVVVGRDAIDIEDFFQAWALSAAVSLDHAADENPLAEPELLDHRARHEGVRAFAREVGGRVAEKAVAVGVHLEHAGAGDEREGLAVFVRLIIGPVLSVSLRSVGTPSSAAAATTSSSALAGTSVVPTLAATVAVTSATTTAPSFSLGHVTQSLNLCPLREKQFVRGRKKGNQNA